MSYTLKYKASIFNANKTEIDVYTTILFNILLGELSDFNIELKKNKIIKDDIFFYTDFEETSNGDYFIVNINALTNKTNEFIKLLEDKLNKKDYTEEEFNLYKKDVIAHLTWSFNSSNNIMGFMTNMYLFDKKIDNNVIDIESNINFKRFKEVIDKLNLDYKSIVILKK